MDKSPEGSRSWGAKGRGQKTVKQKTGGQKTGGQKTGGKSSRTSIWLPLLDIKVGTSLDGSEKKRYYHLSKNRIHVYKLRPNQNEEILFNE